MNKGLFINDVTLFGGGGVSQKMTLSDMGRGWRGQWKSDRVTLHTRGGGGW